MPASCGAGACTVDVRRNSLLSIVLSTGISALCISQYESEFVGHSRGTHSAHRVSFQGAPSVEFSWSLHLSPQLEGVFRRMLPASVAFALCVCCSFLRPLFECSSASFHHHLPPGLGGGGSPKAEVLTLPSGLLRGCCAACSAERSEGTRTDQETRRARHVSYANELRRCAPTHQDGRSPFRCLEATTCNPQHALGGLRNVVAISFVGLLKPSFASRSALLASLGATLWSLTLRVRRGASAACIRNAKVLQAAWR